MHNRVVEFIKDIKNQYPDMFNGKSVLDVGSLDINGNNKVFFTDCGYTGLDIIEGDNVDVVCPIKDYDKHYDVVICTEMLEHDKDWKQSLINMDNISDKMLLVTCANVNRKEHGTTNTTPKDSPATTDYYRNISKEDILSIFPNAIISEDDNKQDLYFYILKH